MRRRVLYDPGSPAAKAAAALLSDEFDVQRVDPARRRGVVLTAVQGPDRRAPHASDRRRRRRGAGPGRGWYGLLPAGGAAGRWWPARSPTPSPTSTPPPTAPASSASWASSTPSASSSRPSATCDVLLETILTKAREITRSDAGSLYLVEEAPDGERGCALRWPRTTAWTITFQAVTLPLDDDSVAGYVALTGDVVNLDDAYAPPAGSPFQINRWFDEHAGLPHEVDAGGADADAAGRDDRRPAAHQLQGRSSTGRLARRRRSSSTCGPSTSAHVQLAGSLASQAAVALANRRLYDSISDLFEGFVKASVTAIESRDPTTSGHSCRVADLTVGLAEASTAAPRGAVPRPALHRRGAARAALRLAAARLRQGRRARARAGQGQEALPRRARPHPPALRAAHARPRARRHPPQARLGRAARRSAATPSRPPGSTPSWPPPWPSSTRRSTSS